MKGIKGQLSSLSITDLMQWIEMNKKSGILFVSNEANKKCFCFRGGKLLLASSKDIGRKFGDILAKKAGVAADDVMRALLEGRRGEVSFLSLMVENGQVPVELLTDTLRQLAEGNIMDILSWPDGFFEFVEGLPPIISESPVELAAGFIVFESVRKHDEKQKGKV